MLEFINKKLNKLNFNLFLFDFFVVADNVITLPICPFAFLGIQLKLKENKYKNK